MELYIILYIFWLKSCCSQAAYQWTPWTRASPCSTTCGKGIISRTRECKPSDSTTIDDDKYCEGPATIEEACYLLPCHNVGSPSSNKCNCGCRLTSSRGQIASRTRTYNDNNKESSMVCSWSIETIAGSSIVLKINKVKNFDWSEGGLYIAGKKRVHKFTEQYGGPKVEGFPIVIQSTSNLLNMTLLYNKMLNPNNNVELDASYTIYEDSSVINNAGSGKKSTKSQSLNIPAIAGIAACALIIVIASIIVACRKIRNKNDEKGETDQPEEGIEDNCSSVSSSYRSGRPNKATKPNSIPGKTFSLPGNCTYSTGPLPEEEGDRLLPLRQPGSMQQRGYPDGNEMFVQKEPTVVTAMPAAGYISGQPYLNWPLQHGQMAPPVQLQQLPQPAIDYMIQQAQLNFTRQMSFEQSKPGSYRYPSSGGEG